MSELIPRYENKVRQYVILTAEDLKPAFQSVREMKNMFRRSGYTFSRLGDKLTVRVFMKEEKEKCRISCLLMRAFSPAGDYMISISLKNLVEVTFSKWGTFSTSL